MNPNNEDRRTQIVDPRQVVVSGVMFDSRTDNEPKPFRMSLLELLGDQHEIHAEKDGPAYSLVEYKPGAKRSSEGVATVTAVVLDLDHLSRVELDRVLGELRGDAYVAYTTFSHQKEGPDDCAVRVVLPVSRPMTANEAHRVRAELLRQLGAKNDPKTEDVGHIFYLPTCPPERQSLARFIYSPGELVNVEQLLADAPAAPAAVQAQVEIAPAPAVAAHQITAGNRHETLFALAGVMRHKGMGEAGIRAALTAENQSRCSPPLSSAEIEKMVKGVMKYAAGELPRKNQLAPVVREDVVASLKGRFESADNPSVVSHLIEWIVRGYVAIGAITLIAGKPKVAGKSTFIAYMIRSVLDGHSFIGNVTRKTPVVVLTEERSTYTELLKRAGLMGRADLWFLRFEPVTEANFAEYIKAGREVAKEIGAKLLIVDTLAQFLRLRGDTENEAGTTLTSLGPLQEAARDGLAVIAVHHERKGTADGGESTRGSSAITGAVDVIVNLRRPEGNSDSKIRKLVSWSRFDATPPIAHVELTDKGFELRDTDGVISNVESTLLGAAPTTPSDAKRLEELIKGTEISAKVARPSAMKLAQTGELVQMGTGKKGSPYRYWKRPAGGFDSSPAPQGRDLETNPPSAPDVPSQDSFPAPTPMSGPGMESAQQLPAPVPFGGFVSVPASKGRDQETNPQTTAPVVPQQDQMTSSSPARAPVVRGGKRKLKSQFRRSPPASVKVKQVQVVIAPDPASVESGGDGES